MEGDSLHELAGTDAESRKAIFYTVSASYFGAEASERSRVADHGFPVTSTRWGSAAFPHPIRSVWDAGCTSLRSQHGYALLRPISASGAVRRPITGASMRSRRTRRDHVDTIELISKNVRATCRSSGCGLCLTMAAALRTKTIAATVTAPWWERSRAGAAPFAPVKLRHDIKPQHA